MCSLYTYANTHMPRFSPSGFFRPSRCLIPTPGAYTLPPALKIEKTQTTPLSLLLSKITPCAKQQVPSQTIWTLPTSVPNAEWTNCSYMNTYAHPVASVYANEYADVHNTGLNVTHLHMPGAHNTCRNACILSAKNAHALVHAHLCDGTQASLPWKL